MLSGMNSGRTSRALPDSGTVSFTSASHHTCHLCYCHSRPLSLFQTFSPGLTLGSLTNPSTIYLFLNYWTDYTNCPDYLTFLLLLSDGIYLHVVLN